MQTRGFDAEQRVAEQESGSVKEGLTITRRTTEGHTAIGKPMATHLVMRPG